MKRICGLVCVLAACSGCTLNSQGEALVSLSLAGTELPDSLVARRDVPVQLSEAKLAFGPLYLCSGTSAGDLCDTARLEWLDAAVVDTLSSEAQQVGELLGATGPVQSYMYDLGITSQLTRSNPFVLEAAASIGDASFVVAGIATVDEIALPFRGSLAIQQTGDTELGVPVIRKSTSEDFSYELDEDTSSLLIRFDPSPWVQGIDFQSFVTREGCLEAGPTIACDGTVERTCEGASELASRDCSDSGQVCVPGQGCRAELVFEAGMTAYRSVRNALLSAGRPRFEWRSSTAR